MAEIDGRIMFLCIVANVVEDTTDDVTAQQDQSAQRMSCKKRKIELGPNVEEA